MNEYIEKLGPGEKHKMTMKFNRTTLELVQDICDNRGVTQTEAFRQGVSCLHQLMKRLADGKQICVIDPQTGEREDLLLL